MQLRPDLHVAIANDRPVFLDVAADRYFCLGGALEQAFLAWFDRPRTAPAKALVEAGILVDGTRSLATPPIDPPRSSLCEAGNTPLPDAVRWYRVAWLVARRHWETNHHPLAVSLERLQRRRSNHARRPPPAIPDIWASYRRHRRTIPIAYSCLLDSLALLDFLGAFGHDARLVIGVTLDPFLAHCWVQKSDLLINDRLGHVGAFTPILVA
ncbi:Transglutaminase-like superfamily protein [Sphingomonas laterariae]|uniref:Transglutaminase-like superfamily protein n=1 Tax=Edaphosphingomonas laterariae TaxID=861865 RepID=A0A239I419_9SPHN|nr:lasso peptide biosynthesis B2 protein [Sphingomonas laterariae]SNS88038.1 Transglutaminase-like superfamily protein [Sphingomonas laterariae]